MLTSFGSRFTPAASSTCSGAEYAGARWQYYGSIEGRRPSVVASPLWRQNISCLRLSTPGRTARPKYPRPANRDQQQEPVSWFLKEKPVIASFPPACGRPALYEKGGVPPTHCGEIVFLFLVRSPQGDAAIRATSVCCRRDCFAALAMTNAFDLKNSAFTTLVSERRCMRRFILTRAPGSGKTERQR